MTSIHCACTVLKAMAGTCPAARLLPQPGLGRHQKKQNVVWVVKFQGTPKKAFPRTKTTPFEMSSPRKPLSSQGMSRPHYTPLIAPASEEN